jgi:hypothetical protein
MQPPTPTDYAGTAFASLALNMAILGKMRSKGLLSKEEIAEMVDVATVVLEQGGLDLPAQKVAHGLLQGILSIVESGKLPQK